MTYEEEDTCMAYEEEETYHVEHLTLTQFGLV
jgi:hypothetical protein